jgi:hypothetical protein
VAVTRYDPERTLRELRAALAGREQSFRDMGAIMAQAARAARADLWPDRPDLAEAAGLGAVVAAATMAGHARPGGDATMLNCVGLFGLALVEQARGIDSVPHPLTIDQQITAGPAVERLRRHVRRYDRNGDPAMVCVVNPGARRCPRCGACLCLPDPDGTAMIGDPKCPMHGDGAEHLHGWERPE